MDTNRNRLAYLLTIALPVALLFAIVGLRQNNAINGIKADVNYSITLDASNTPTLLTPSPTSDSFVGPKGVAFSYISASTSAGKFMSLADSGSIKNESQITTIKSYNIVFSGDCLIWFGWEYDAFEVGYWQGDNLQSGVTHTIDGDYYYFQITSYSGIVDITSITISYSCVPTPAASVYTLAADGLSYIVTGYSKRPSEIVIPSTYNNLPVTEIAPYAFYDLYSLLSIYIPNSVAKIGEYAFYECNYLAQVRLPAGLTELSPHLFESCSALKEITLPETLEIIGDFAFALSGLLSITIPSSVATLGLSCFSSTSSLDGVSFGEPISFNHIAASMFEGSANSTIVLPEGVESIGTYAFSSSSLEAITFPSTLTTIEEYAFYYSDYFSSIDGYLSNVTQIGRSAFDETPWHDDRLNGDNLVAFDDRITVDGKSSSGSIEISEGIVSISDFAFEQNTQLTSVTMPSTLLKIGIGAFDGNASLATADLTLSTGLLVIGAAAFNQYSSLSSLSVPASVLDVGEGAFDGTPWQDGQAIPFIINNRVIIKGQMSGDITLPATITAINADAFYGSALTSIILPEGLLRIGDRAFSYCANLVNITIPNSVLTLGMATFANSGLTAATVGSSIKELPSYLFSSNATLVSITLPAGLQEIGDLAFYECISLTGVILPDGLKAIGINSFAKTQALTSMTIPGSILSIPQEAFSLSGLTNLVVSDGVQSIGDSAFQDCPSLASVSLPSTLFEIGNYAFEGCEALTEIVIPLSVSWVGGYCFDNCSSLSIYLEAISTPETWDSDWNVDNRPVTYSYVQE